MLNYGFTKKFKKDYKKAIKRHWKIEHLDEIVELIINELPLSYEHKNHILEPRNKYPQKWECHVNGRNSDWLLIYHYEVERNLVIFERTGTHSELFK